MKIRIFYPQKNAKILCYQLAILEEWLPLDRYKNRIFDWDINMVPPNLKSFNDHGPGSGRNSVPAAQY